MLHRSLARKVVMAAVRTKDHCVGLFDIENQLIGYAISVLEDDRIHLANIAVDPDHRRNGVGRMLLNEALGFAVSLNARAVYLEVRISNEPAISLYRSAGFTVEKIEEEFYSDAEDALVLIRKLDGVV